MTIPATVTAEPETQPSADLPAGNVGSPSPEQPAQQTSVTAPKNDTSSAAQQSAPEGPVLPLTPRDGLGGLENAIEAKVTGNINHNGEHIANVVDSTLPIFGPGVLGPGGPFDSISGKPLKITP
jgi:hypothetical protein